MGNKLRRLLEQPSPLKLERRLKAIKIAEHKLGILGDKANEITEEYLSLGDEDERRSELRRLRDLIAVDIYRVAAICRNTRKRIKQDEDKKALRRILYGTVASKS